MQKEQSGEVATQEAGIHVQALMEEYLRLKHAGAGSWTLAAKDQTLDQAPDTLLPTADTLRQQVVDGMAPLVEAIARRYAGTREAGGCSEPLEDLVSEGYIGLLSAIDQYRADRGARFSTYATHRVHGQIRHYLRDRGSKRLIRAPSWLQELTVRLHREEEKLLAELGRPATTAELAERLNLREEAVEEVQQRGAGPAVFSLSERAVDDEDGSGLDAGKFRSQHYVSWQLPVEDHIFLEELMGRLKDLEQRVIRLFFFQDLSQSEIARSLNISCNYVGYLLKNGLRRLRRLIEADELRDAQLRVTYAPRRMAGDGCVIDAATGLYTAEYLHGRLSEEIARACRYQRELALVVIRVPLPHGSETGAAPLAGKRARRKRVPSGGTRRPESAISHLVPEAFSLDRVELMRELGTALRECLRKADIPARVGEGTLAVALPQTGEGAHIVAERITRLLSQVAGCGATSGVSFYPMDGREPAMLLQVADSKAGGSEELPDAGIIPLEVIQAEG